MAELREKADVIKRLCRITSKIGKAKGFAVPTDCYCADDNKDPRWSFRFDSEVLDYVEAAVDTALAIDQARKQ